MTSRCARHLPMARLSIGKARTMRGQRCFDPKIFLVIALPRKHTPHPFVVRNRFMINLSQPMLYLDVTRGKPDKRSFAEVAWPC